MPDGHTYSLDRFKGLDQIGETGLKDEVNRHYLQVFGASLAIGALVRPRAIQHAAGSTPSTSSDTYRQAAGASLAASAEPRPRSLPERAADHHDPRRLSHQGLSHERSRPARVRAERRGGVQ